MKVNGCITIKIKNYVSVLISFSAYHKFLIIVLLSIFSLLLISGEQLATELGCSYLEVAAAEQVQPTCAVFHEVCREVLALRRRGKQSLLDRMIASAKSSSKTTSGGAGPRTYLRGKSDSALP